jgi:hypothetical protein
MGITPVTISHSTSTELPDVAGNSAKLWNPPGSGANVSLHLEGAAGVTPVAETHSTASLDIEIDTTDGEVDTTDIRFVDDDGELWEIDDVDEDTYPEATNSTATVTVTGDTSSGEVTIPAGKRVCKAAEVATGPYWETDDETVLPAATYGTAVARFTIDNDGNEVTIPEGQAIKKAAVATLWEADEESVTPSATKSTAVVTLTGAQGTTYPAGTHVKKAAVAQLWETAAEKIIVNGVTATYGHCLSVELLGTPATVIAAGKRICKTGEDGSGPYWALDAEVVIAGNGMGHGDFTCSTLGAIAATAGQLNTIKDAVAGWASVENDSAATPGLAAANGTIDANVSCEARGAEAALAGSLDTLPTPPGGHVSCTNALAATVGLPIVATVDVPVTCADIGAIAALATTLDTIVTAPDHVSAVTNPNAATPGLTATPTDTVGVTCLEEDDVAALAHALDTIKDAVAGWTAVDNANPATPGVDAEHSVTVGVTAVRGGVIEAAAHEIAALEAPLSYPGITSVDNSAPATPGVAFAEGTDGDFAIPPGTGHPYNPRAQTAQALADGASDVLCQILTGVDAAQENIATLEGVEVDVDLPAATAADPLVIVDAATPIGPTSLLPLVVGVPTPQDLTDTAANLGSQISVAGKTKLALFLKIDVNNSVNVRVLLQYKFATGGDAYYAPNLSYSSSDVKYSVPEYYELDVDADTSVVLEMPLDGVVPFVQIQVYAGTVGAPTAGQIDSAYYVVR